MPDPFPDTGRSTQRIRTGPVFMRMPGSGSAPRPLARVMASFRGTEPTAFGDIAR